MDPTTLQVWSWLGMVLGTLVLAVALLWAGKEFTVQLRGLWRVLRTHESQLKAAIDDPADIINRRLAQVSGMPSEVWAVLLPAMLEAFMNGLADIGAVQPSTPVSSAETVGPGSEEIPR